MYSCGPPHMDVQERDDQHEHTYSNYVRTQDVTLKTCRRRWMIGRNGERGSRISALAARHDDEWWWIQEFFSNQNDQSATFELPYFRKYKTVQQVISEFLVEWIASWCSFPHRQCPLTLVHCTVEKTWNSMSTLWGLLRIISCLVSHIAPLDS